MAWPRVPGHEVVGRIDALGSGVQGRTIGQRVGVGFLAGFCGYCEFCRNGDLVNCRNQEFTGVHNDGGYAEVMIAKASGLVSIPESLCPERRLAMIETVPLEQAADAYAKMMAGKARFRMVLVMKNGASTTGR